MKKVAKYLVIATLPFTLSTPVAAQFANGCAQTCFNRLARCTRGVHDQAGLDACEAAFERCLETCSL